MPASTARRVNRGRGHSYSVDGKPFAGVTTVIGKALPKPALTAWAAREAAELVAARREILTQLTDEELIDLVKGAPFRTRDKAANRGTEVHRLAEKLARGQEVEVPEELVGHVDSYVAFLEQFKPTDALVELPVFNRKWRYAGTADLLTFIERERLNLAGADRARCLIDVKTNRSGPFGETAIQLGAYGNAEFYVDPDGVEVPMPAIDFYGVLWLRADGFDLYKFDVTDREFKTFQYLLATTWWIENRQDHVKGDAIWTRQEVAR